MKNEATGHWLHGEQVLILHNRRAGQRGGVSKVDQLEQTLRESGLQPVKCGSVEQLAEAHARGSARAVVCAGGDGTANAAFSVVGHEVPLLPYPLGNENLLAKYLGVTTDAHQCAERLVRGRAAAFDVGVHGDRHFMLMLSSGIDADVVERVHRHRTGHISRRDYVRQMWRALQEYRFEPIIVEWMDPAGTHQTVEGHWVFVFNFPTYACGLGLAAEADPQDGWLDVRVFRGNSIIRNLGHLVTVWTRSHGDWSGCYKFRATQLRLSSPAVVPIQFDGDPGGQTSVDVHILPRGMQLVMGPSPGPA
ncbi:MAG: diacylglycerol kinase family protein [Planctomycetota bacterium]